MTLIAGFLRDGCPVLMGDLLVSDMDESDKEFVFPTVGKVSKREIRNGTFSPAHLCQKVILISPKLAISWANKKIYAKSFVRAVIDANAHTNPSRELLSEIYNEIGGQGNISIIGLYRNGVEMGLFDFESWHVDPPHHSFRYFKAVGSGYATLLELIPRLREGVPSRNLNKLEKGIATAVHLTTSLLSREVLSPLSLEELFGVGYEIAHPLGAGLAKFSNLTYVFWAAEEVDSGTWKMLPFPFLTFNYSYKGDVLIIRSVRTSVASNSNSCRIESDELHAISPIQRTLDPYELAGHSPLTLNADWICGVFLWKNCLGHTGTFATFGHYSNQSAPIIWTNEFSKNAGIDVNTQFIKTSISKVALHALESSGDSVNDS
jgi:hypothetical protein